MGLGVLIVLSCKRSLDRGVKGRERMVSAAFSGGSLLDVLVAVVLATDAIPGTMGEPSSNSVVSASCCKSRDRGVKGRVCGVAPEKEEETTAATDSSVNLPPCSPPLTWVTSLNRLEEEEDPTNC